MQTYEKNFPKRMFRKVFKHTRNHRSTSATTEKSYSHTPSHYTTPKVENDFSP